MLSEAINDILQKPDEQTKNASDSAPITADTSLK
jgi:hypothetical protein